MPDTRHRPGPGAPRQPLTTALPHPLRALRWSILAGIALLLLMPFVVTPETVYPYVVGKAVWSRALIEIVFALWAVLALAHPSYRPPRSWLLIALAAGWVAAALAAGFGVSAQRSLWSTYERMQGVVDLTHWVALAVVLTAMFRTASGWRALLTLNVLAGVAMACLSIARYYQLSVPFYGMLPELQWPRIGGPLGNPLYLSGYMLVQLWVALGFLAQSCLSVPDAAPPSRRRQPRGRRRRPATQRRPRQGSRWPAIVGWAVAVALLSWAFGLTRSAGGYVGLAAGGGFLVVTGAFLGRRRTRRVAVAALVALGAAAVPLGIHFFSGGPAPTAPWLDNPVGRQIARISLQQDTVQSRLTSWRTGLEGFAERPLFGWGPGNFEAVFGRFASGYASVTDAHDHAHSEIVEVAATTGIGGLAAYLALWTLAFTVVWRAARTMDGQSRTLTLFVGAALASMLAFNQFLFSTAPGSLHAILLLSFAAGLETTAFRAARRPRLPARLTAAGAALLDRRGVRIALAATAVGVAAVGLKTHQSVFTAANTRHLAGQSPPSTLLARNIEAFQPLANTFRRRLFAELDLAWERLRVDDTDRARRLLEWAEREAAEVVRTEPQSWQIHHTLARLYRTVATTDPQHQAAAQRYLERARTLAPNRAVFPVATGAPDALTLRRLDDGRHELRWNAPEGAGYYRMGWMTTDGDWRILRVIYDPDRTSLVLPAPPTVDEPGVCHWIKACGAWQRCSAWVGPPVATPVPAGEPAPGPCPLSAVWRGGMIELAWNDPGDPGITGYEFRVRSPTDRTWRRWNPMFDSDATTTGYRLTGLGLHRKYAVQVRAQYADGTGEPSTAVAGILPE